MIKDIYDLAKWLYSFFSPTVFLVSICAGLWALFGDVLALLDGIITAINAANSFTAQVLNSDIAAKINRLLPLTELVWFLSALFGVRVAFLALRVLKFFIPGW